MAIYKLGDIGVFKGGISTLKKELYSDNGVIFVNYMDVYRNYSIGQVEVEKMKRYLASSNDLKKYSLKYGDAIFTASSETPEEIAISTIFLANCDAIFNGFSKRFTFNHEILIPKYASFLFRCTHFREEAKKFATGYTRYNISQTDLCKIKVNIPNIIDQQKIIDIIEPVEKMENHFFNIRKNIINLISNIGEKGVSTKKGVKLNIQKQKETKFSKGNYIQTADISDFTNEITNFEYYDNSLPSRARVLLKPNNLYISKLDGERKILFRSKYDNELIISNGMWGIETDSEFKYSIYSFFFTKNYYDQKTLNSTGTTMRGLNDKTLLMITESIRMNTNNFIEEELESLFKMLSLVTILLEKLKKIKEKQISLLIK